MKFENIAVLTSEESWFIPHAKKLICILNDRGYRARFFSAHEEVAGNFDVVFILSYFRIVEESFLKRHRHNLVVHESDLPQGKGWAPLFWQILEGKDKVPVVLFDATDEVDAGNIYIKGYIFLEGHELHDEIRRLQARKTIELCLKFLENHDDLKPVKQTGKETFYAGRTPADSELDISKTIKEQFNLLRTVSNEQFPAFFYNQGYKYIVRISKQTK